MRNRGDAPFILHEDGSGWLHVAEGFAGRPVPDALRAAGIAGAKSVLLTRHEPGCELVHTRTKTVSHRQAIRVFRTFSPLTG